MAQGIPERFERHAVGRHAIRRLPRPATALAALLLATGAPGLASAEFAGEVLNVYDVDVASSVPGVSSAVLIGLRKANRV